MSLLLNRIEHYCAHRSLAATAFGRRAANDPRLLLDMRRGRRPGPLMVARIEAIMAERQA